MQRIILAALILLGSLSTASAVLIDTSGTITYQNTAPTGMGDGGMGGLTKTA